MFSLIRIGFGCICGELILDLCNARTLCSEPKHFGAFQLFLWQIEKSCHIKFVSNMLKEDAREPKTYKRKNGERLSPKPQHAGNYL